MSERCPNEFPVLDPGELRIAIAGEAPGEDEIHQSRPFVGRSGRLLDDALERVGLVRGRMFVGNVSQHRPKDNSFDHFEWDGAEVQEGIAQLRADLEKFKPNIVLCLGNAALNLFKHGNLPPRKVWRQGRRQFDWPSRVGDWRGSLFESAWLTGWRLQKVETERGQIGTNEFFGCKCLAAIHPAAVCRDYSLQAYYRVEPGVGDFERLKVEAATPGLELPRREVKVYNPLPGYRMYKTGPDDCQHVLGLMSWLAKSPKPIAVDIEGGPGNVTSIAFATRRDVAHVVPLAGIDGRSIWTEEQEVAIWEGVKVLLEDARIPKLVMNASYDFFAIPWTYGITPQGELLDIMESAWEWQPELRLGLATQVSLLTKWPFYKPDKEEGELKFASDEQFWTYNGHDAANTVECYEETCKRLDKGQRSHFRFNVELGAARLFQMLRGVLVDMERVKEEITDKTRKAWKLQADIDRAAGQDDWQVLAHCVECLKIEAVTDVEKLAEPAFARLVLARLGGKNPAVPTEVVVERWQPMRWGGARWKKNGKLFEGSLKGRGEYSQLPPGPPVSQGWSYTGADGWLKPAHKTILRRLPFTPSTLADCEPHVLESKRAEWKRVKAIWKELNQHDYRPATKHNSKRTGENHPPVEFFAELASNRTATGFDCSALLGELSLLLGLGVNTGSNNEGGDSQWFLYEVCGLPRIYKNERTGKYSRESEKEWKARTSKGVTHERRRAKKLLAVSTVREPVGAGAGSPPEGHRGTPDGDQPAPGRGGEGGAGAGGAGRQAGENEGRLDDTTPTGADRSGVADGETAPATLEPVAGQAESGPARSGKRPSTDQQALDLLYAYTRDERCLWVLQQRRLRKIVSDLKGELVDHDGRARSSVSFVKETGRMAESEAPHGTGLGNRQALNKDLRRIVVAG